jgi:putative flippase GtrA
MTAEPEKPAKSARHAAKDPVARNASAMIEAFIKILPKPIRQRLETEPGKRFSRFLPVAIAALASSQISLAILTGPITMDAGKAALLASIIGAAVSYLLSRWAWERKGRPDLLRETVPFWLVSFAVWGILSLTTHYAGHWANEHHLHHIQRHLVVQGTYLFANCFTFVTRFLIFHYLLFRRRGTGAEEALPEPSAELPRADFGVVDAARPAQAVDGQLESSTLPARRKP